MVISAIDPGATGAIAVIDTEIDLSFVHDMPIVDKEINIPAVVEILEPLVDPIVIIEVQQSFPRQGVASTFTTGKRYGVLLGIIGTLGLECILVRPATWKKMYSIGRDKEAACLLAADLYPDHEYYGKRGGKKDGRAEAILMAHWGKENYERD